MRINNIFWACLIINFLTFIKVFGNVNVANYAPADSSLRNSQKEIYYNKGNDFSDKKMYEKAIIAYNKSLELDPNYKNAIYNRGNANRNARKYNEAIKDYNRVLELDPSFFKAIYNRGFTYEAMGNYNSAIKDMNNILVDRPEYKPAYLTSSKSKFCPI